MTYFEAVSIEQDFKVNLQYAFGETAVEAFKKIAKKYTDEQLASAFEAIKEKALEDIKDALKLFEMALVVKREVT